MDISPLQAENWDELKSIRLKALKESPFAFGSTLEEEAKLSDEEWKSLARRHSPSDDIYFVLSRNKISLTGMAGVRRDQSKQSTSHVFSVWVDPTHRGSGLAKDLMRNVEEWACMRGFDKIEGYVTENNQKARSFYRKLGFSETDETISLRWMPSIAEILIEKK